MLISNYDESKVKFILNRHKVIGYGLDLNDHKPSNRIIGVLVDIWKEINKDRDSGDSAGKSLEKNFGRDEL